MKNSIKRKGKNERLMVSIMLENLEKHEAGKETINDIDLLKEEEKKILIKKWKFIPSIPKKGAQ